MHDVWLLGLQLLSKNGITIGDTYISTLTQAISYQLDMLPDQGVAFGIYI
jgi:hypothetical protein